MTRLGRWWRFWVTLMARREAGTSLAWFRVGLGLCVIYSLLSIRAAGLMEVLWLGPEDGGYGAQPHAGWLFGLLGGVRPGTLQGVYGVALVGALATAVGVGGRLVILVTLQGYIALVRLNGFTSGGYDIMITNGLWLLFLGDAMATCSLSCRWRTGRWTSDVQVSAWPRYLLIFQLVVVYTATGLYKLSADWTPAGGYGALYHVFQDPTWRRFDMSFTAWIYPLTQAATAMVWHWETGFWLLLLVYYYRYTREREGRLRRLCNRWDLRLVFLGLGLMMHVGILVVFNVGPFSWVSLAYYVCFFEPREVAAAMARLRRRGAIATGDGRRGA